jgi:hypothetical protein
MSLWAPDAALYWLEATVGMELALCSVLLSSSRVLQPEFWARIPGT